MKKNIFHTALLLFAAITLISCGNNQNGAQTNAAAARQSKARPVTAIKIPTKTVTTYNDYPASIEGIVNSGVRPKISGYITDVLVDEGQKVKKGQRLFKLETQSLSQQAQAAQANVNAAKVEVNKLKPLIEKNIISQVQLETAKAKLQQAKSNYQSITANIGYANIKSPVDGYVGEIRLRKGNLVSPSNQKPLTTVSEISKVYAYFSMNEKEYLNFIQKAKGNTREEKIENLPKVKLILANGELYKHKGTIQTINSQIGKQTGSVSFRAIFDNPQQILTNGSSGQIKVPTIYKDIPVVPKKSTFEQQGRTYVMKVEKSDTVAKAISGTIKIKNEKGNLYLVESGVKKGDAIVAEGVDKLQSGMPIKPRQQPFDSIAKPLPTVFK